MELWTRDALRAGRHHESMNPDQGRIFDTILEWLEDPNGGLFFNDGRAGRGKTFLTAAICDRIRGDGGKAQRGFSFLFS